MSHHRVLVGVDAQQRVADDLVVSALASPSFPQAGHCDWIAVAPTELPPDVLGRLPVRLEEGIYGDDAALSRAHGAS
jgi:hypothetical protein